MRELCIENIAMSTRVAFPMLFGCRMSELRRHLVPSPTPTSQEHSGQHQIQQQQVRRNLFGPIDHEENIKFVQNELDKIAQSDRKKWNFDFQKEKPLPGGRLQWEPVTEGVPQAYEMPRLNCLSTTTTTTSTSSITSRGKISNTSDTVSSSSSSSSTSSSVSRVPECPNTIQSNKITTPVTAAAAPTTSEKPTTTFLRKTSPAIQNQPSCSDTKSHSSEIVVVSSKHCSSSNNNKNNNDTKSDLCLATKKNLPSPSVTNATRARSATTSSSSSPSQSNITAFMKIRKKRPTETKLEDEQPPALVSKRSKTTPS